MTNQEIINALRTFVSQRSGIEWRNYYQTWSDSTGVQAFRVEQRKIAKDGKHARQLLTLCELLKIPLTRLVRSQDRLNMNVETASVEYTTGQYFPTEYRAAVCRACASAIWDWLINTERARNRAEVQAWIKARLGRGIANAWFN